MTSILLARANPAFLQPSQDQAALEEQQRILSEYLAKSAECGQEEEEAVFSSDEDEDEEPESVKGVGQSAIGGTEEEEEEEEAEAEEPDVERLLCGHLGGSGWEGRSAEELLGAFIALRHNIRSLEQRLAQHGQYKSRWGPASDEDGDEEGDDTDDSGAHLAGWLGGMSETDLAKATREDVLWWLVDMCKVVDGLKEMLEA